MTLLLALAVILYVMVWVVWWLLRHLLMFSIEVEQEALRKSRRPASDGIVGTISVLRTLEAISLTIFAAIMPIGGVVLGMVLPAHVRAWLDQFIGPGALVAVTIAALFAYGAVFLIWQRHEGSKIRKRLLDALLSKK